MEREHYFLLNFQYLVDSYPRFGVYFLLAFVASQATEETILDAQMRLCILLAD